MYLLEIFGAIICNLLLQAPEPSPAISSINKYVSNLTKEHLIPFQLWRTPLKRSDVLARDTIFFAYGTDFPCSATVYYLDGKIVETKEVINYSSAFIVNYYFIKNNQLLFLEEKQIFCPFKQQSPKIKYAEKDYAFHAKSYFSDNKLLSSKENGKRIHRHSAEYTSYFPRDGSVNFFVWQAARYTLLFYKSFNK